MDHSSRSKILRQLSRTQGKVAENALNEQATRIAHSLMTETRYDLLEQQIELLDVFAFRVPQAAIRIGEKFIERLDSLVLTYDDGSVLSDFELDRYQSKDDLLIDVLKLLDRIRYHRPREVLRILMNHSSSAAEEVKKQVNLGLEHLAEYNIDVYYSGDHRAGLGPAPQLEILDFVESLAASEKRQNLSTIVELLEHLLSPTMRGTSWDYRSVRISTAPIPSTDDIKIIRQRCLRLLRELYALAGRITEKMAVVDAMLNSTRMPHTGHYSDDVSQMILADTVDVLGYFKELLDGEDLQIMQRVEHHAFWQFRHASTLEVQSAALEIRELIRGDIEYGIYRDLIGFEGVFEDWEEAKDRRPNFRATDEYRSAKAQEYADSINMDNWVEWRQRILRYVTTESDDLATFPHFFSFLRRFAGRSPHLALRLLREDLDEIELFTIPLLRGLWESTHRSQLRELMLEWIAADQQLVAVAKLFISNDSVDEDLLQVLLEKGLEEQNRSVLIAIVAVAVSAYAQHHFELISRFFLPAIEALSKMSDVGWIDELWYRKELSEIIEGLTEEGQEVVLSSLIKAPQIDYHVEELLAPLARSNPLRVITLFGQRQAYEENVSPGARYDAIPFEFHELHEILAQFPEQIVDRVRTWYREDAELFQYRGANLLKIIFPRFSDRFEKKLFDLVRTGEKANIKFVLSVLRNYEGEGFLHEICKEIVKNLPHGDELLTTVEIVLQNTGVVVGEYGLAEAYAARVEEIKPWLSDDSDKVRIFAGRLMDHLERWTEVERRRADEDIELRKHTYGVGGRAAGESDDSANE